MAPSPHKYESKAQNSLRLLSPVMGLPITTTTSTMTRITPLSLVIRASPPGISNCTSQMSLESNLSAVFLSIACLVSYYIPATQGTRFEGSFSFPNGVTMNTLPRNSRAIGYMVSSPKKWASCYQPNSQETSVWSCILPIVLVHSSIRLH